MTHESESIGWTAAGIYDVDITVPCEMTWRIHQQESFEERTSRLSPEKLEEMPSVKTTDTEDGGLALVLSWVNVAAESASAAIAKVVEIMASELPEVYGQVRAHIAAEIQDPDTERRRPRGATGHERVTNEDREARLAIAFSAETQATNLREAENHAQRLADAAIETPLGHELVDVVARQWKPQSPTDESDPLKGATAWVRDRMVWAARWALTTAQLYEIDLDVTADTVAMIGGTKCVGWPDAPEPGQAATREG